jgi:hypothetical protein
MVKTSARTKGDLLEDAVRAIEDTILRSAPGFAEGTFKIQGKRIITSAGVRHEVDLFVTVSLPAGYDTVFIFECKNWKSKVGKNEIIVFSEKVASIGAHKGFFVARSFTKDARAQAAKDQRIQLLTASHIEPISRVEFPQFIHTHIISTEAHLQFAGLIPGQFPKQEGLDISQSTVSIAGVSIPAPEYVNGWIQSERDHEVARSQASELPDGTHRLEFSEQFTFQEGEAFLDQRPLAKIAIRGCAQVAITRGAVISVFEVHSRGRMITVGVDAHGLEIRMDVVELDNPAGAP